MSAFLLRRSVLRVPYDDVRQAPCCLLLLLNARETRELLRAFASLVDRFVLAYINVCGTHSTLQTLFNQYIDNTGKGLMFDKQVIHDSPHHIHTPYTHPILYAPFFEYCLHFSSGTYNTSCRLAFPLCVL